MNPLLVKFRNDRIFREGTFPEMRSEYVADVAPEPVARKTEFRVRENLVRTDTVSAVLSFPGRRVCALNFANANVPGGAYVLGAWGCGVFGNRRETVYPQFERAINRYLPDDVRVVFADPRPAPEP